MTKVLLVDNYDSFTYNLAHLFEELGAEVIVLRNDEVDADESERLEPTHLVVSPGPGRPEHAGASIETPASAGPPGPGDTTRCDGAMRSACSAVMASLRRTITSAPSSPNRCARLYVNES